MDLIKKINKMIPEDGTVTPDVAQNTTKGSVDVVGGECPDGYHYCPKRKKCIKDEDIIESVVAAAVVGSQQTRSVGEKDKYVMVLRRNPRPLKFNKLLGGYLPPEEDDEEIIPGEPIEVDESFGFNDIKKWFDYIQKAWWGLEVLMDKKQKEIYIMTGTGTKLDAVYEWAKDHLPIKFKISKGLNQIIVKV